MLSQLLSLLGFSRWWTHSTKIYLLHMLSGKLLCLLYHTSVLYRIGHAICSASVQSQNSPERAKDEVATLHNRNCKRKCPSFDPCCTVISITVKASRHWNDKISGKRKSQWRRLSVAVKGIYILNALHQGDVSETSSETSEVTLFGGIIRSVFVFTETLNKSWHVLFPRRWFSFGTGNSCSSSSVQCICHFRHRDYQGWDEWWSIVLSLSGSPDKRVDNY